MSLSTFSDLRTAISTWMARTDFTAAQLTEFVKLAEGDMRDDLETRDGEQTATGTMTSDGFTAPTGFMHARGLFVDGHRSSYLPPGEYDQMVDLEVTSGYHTIRGDSFEVINGNGSSYSLRYFGKLTGLSADGDTNWVLTNKPNVYLFGACKYACVFLKDSGGAGEFEAMYRAAVTQLNAMEKRAKVSGPLVIRPDVVE